MATAKKLPSGSWRCLVYDYTGADGKRHYKSFTCNDPSAKGKRKVEAEAAAWAADKGSKKGGTEYQEITFGEAMNNYIKSRSAVLSPSTIREYKRSRRNDLQNLMDVKLGSITQEMIQAEINRESINHAPKTVRNMHGLLTAVMGAYRPDFALKTKLPEKVRPNLYIPSDDDITRLMDAVRGTSIEIPVLLAAFGPMRRGEICALDSDHVNGNVVHVEYSMVMNDEKKWVIKAPKSYAGDRYIEFPDFVAEKLSGKKGRIVEILPSQVTDYFSDTLKRAGIPHFRFHDLRHYSASIQHAIGIPDVYIMRRGGWGNDSVLKSIYRHAMEEQEVAMNKKANDYFGMLCNTKCNTDERTH